MPPLESEAPASRETSPDKPLPERRHPLCFVWQMDGEGRFVVESGEFIELVGPRSTAAPGQIWSEIAAELKLDPDGRVALAIATRRTWSGITVLWPVDDGGERLQVELSGIPVFDRDRGFCGYRGFGICRERAQGDRTASIAAAPGNAVPPCAVAPSEPNTTAADEVQVSKRDAELAAAKAEFVTRVSREIRTPLNAITGFAEMMLAERFESIGNERCREYLKDIHAAGMQLASLLNDLLDLSKVETGQLELTFADVNLNELTQQCVGIMQPQASRARIIIRTSLTPGLRRVTADERSLRQIVFNLLANSIRFTGPGGQAIVSTAFADSGEAVLRVRDTGVGMSEQELQATLEPFRQTGTSATWGSGGVGLALPLARALAEANRAHFTIKTAPNAGTLVEIAFPPARVVAG